MHPTPKNQVIPSKFSAHGDVVVGFAILHIVLFQKERKKKRKKALLHGM
jgi:hypothetical protein